MSTPPEFDARIETTSPGVTVVRVRGDLDMASCSRLEEAITASRPAARLIVDLTACTFLDSSGVGVLVGAQRTLAADDGALELVVTDPNLLRVLEITNVNTVLTVHSTLDAAL